MEYAIPHRSRTQSAMKANKVMLEWLGVGCRPTLVLCQNYARGNPARVGVCAFRLDAVTCIRCQVRQQRTDLDRQFSYAGPGDEDVPRVRIKMDCDVRLTTQ